MRKAATSIRRRSDKQRGRDSRAQGRRSAASDRDSDVELRFDAARFEAVMRAAERSGLLKEKNGRIAGRVSLALVKQAKKQTGIEGDTELIAFALASVALEDNFAEVFKASRGKTPAALKLGF